MYLVLSFTMPTGKALSKWSLKQVSVQKERYEWESAALRPVPWLTFRLVDVLFSYRYILLKV